MTSYSLVTLPVVGELLLVASELGLTGVYFADRRHAPATGRDWNEHAEHPLLRQAAEEIGEYLTADRIDFSLPLAYDGTALQRAVWAEIAQIPYGQTISYSDLAQRVNASDAVRAVGAATGQNPLSIVIPCHRVVAKDGALCGYAGGLQRKERLLRMEIMHRAVPAEMAGMLFGV